MACSQRDEIASQSQESLTVFLSKLFETTFLIITFQYVEPLLKYFPREILSEEEMVECQGCIYKIMSMEQKNEALPWVSSGIRGKGPKRY